MLSLKLWGKFADRFRGSAVELSQDTEARATKMDLGLIIRGVPNHHPLMMLLREGGLSVGLHFMRFR